MSLSKQFFLSPQLIPSIPLDLFSAQQRVYGVAKQENAEIKCIVDANPPEVDFKWTFNNSAESIDVAASHVSRHGGEFFPLFLPSLMLQSDTLSQLN
jgi:hypothetical protein